MLKCLAAERRGGPRKEISFVRGETTGGEKNDGRAKVVNPDEIDIDEDDDDDNDEEEKTVESN